MTPDDNSRPEMPTSPLSNAEEVVNGVEPEPIAAAKAQTPILEPITLAKFAAILLERIQTHDDIANLTCVLERKDGMVEVLHSDQSYLSLAYAAATLRVYSDRLVEKSLTNVPPPPP